jgi:hypothetical protein
MYLLKSKSIRLLVLDLASPVLTGPAKNRITWKSSSPLDYSVPLNWSTMQHWGFPLEPEKDGGYPWSPEQDVIVVAGTAIGA